MQWVEAIILISFLFLTFNNKNYELISLYIFVGFSPSSRQRQNHLHLIYNIKEAVETSLRHTFTFKFLNYIFINFNRQNISFVSMIYDDIRSTKIATHLDSPFVNVILLTLFGYRTKVCFLWLHSTYFSKSRL